MIPLLFSPQTVKTVAACRRGNCYTESFKLQEAALSVGGRLWRTLPPRAHTPTCPSLRVVCAPTPAGNCLCVPLTAAHWAREQCRRAPYPQPAISRRWSFRDLTLGRAIQCVRESPDTVSAVCLMTWECGQPPCTARGHEFIPGESLGGELRIGVQLVAMLHMEHSK